MRVLLDECLPRRLKQAFSGHDVVTVPEAGWAGKQNGELIRLAEGRYDVFLTVDQNLPAQQATGKASLSVLIVRASSNRYEEIRPLIPDILKALDAVGRGQRLHVGTSSPSS